MPSIKDILPRITAASEDEKILIIQDFLSDPENICSSEEFARLLLDAKFEKEKNRANALILFLETRPCSSVDFALMLKPLEQEKESYLKLKAFEAFFANHDNTYNGAEFLDFFKDFKTHRTRYPVLALKLLERFFENPNLACSVTDFLTILNGSEIKEHPKATVICQFLKKHKTVCSEEEFIKISAYLSSGEFRTYSLVLSAFLENPNTKCSTEGFQKILNNAQNIDPTLLRVYAILPFLRSRGTVCSEEEFIKILSFIEEGKGPYDMPIIVEYSPILSSFLENPNTKCSVKGLRTILANEIIKADINAEPFAILINYLRSQSGYNADEMLQLINEQSLDDELAIQHYRETAIAFIKTQKPKTLEKLIDLISHLKPEFKYDCTEIAKLLTSITEENEEEDRVVTAENLIDFVTKLYPGSTYLQLDFLEQLVLSKFISKDAFKQLKLDDLADNVVLEFLEKCHVSLNLSELEILEACGKRLNSRYESLARILADKTVAQCLLPQALLQLESLFGKSVAKLPISAIISYYDVRQNLATVGAMFVPQIREEIKKQFHPTAKQLVYSKAELQKFAHLTQSSVDETAVAFTPIAALCDKFKGLEVTRLTAQQEAEFVINFEDSLILSEDREALNAAIREAFNSSAIDDFFAILTKERKDDPKLREVFRNLKSEIAYLLTRKNGIDDLLAATVTLSHGCAHNMGTQIKLAVFAALLKERSEAEKILYQALNDSISTILTNPWVGDIIDTNSNPLKNPNITTNFFLSPEALFTLVSSYFRGENKQFDPFADLGDKNLMQQLLDGFGCNRHDVLSALDIDDYENSSAQLAAYLVIKTLLPAEAEKLTQKENFEAVLRNAQFSHGAAATAENGVPSASPEIEKTISVEKRFFLEKLRKDLGLTRSAQYSRFLPFDSLEKILAPVFEEEQQAARGTRKLKQNPIIKGETVELDLKKIEAIKEILQQKFSSKGAEISQITLKNFEKQNGIYSTAVGSSNAMVY